MVHKDQISLGPIRRLPELAGVVLFGAGVILFLSSLLYIPLTRLPVQSFAKPTFKSGVAGSFVGAPLGYTMLLFALGLLFTGYVIVKNHIPNQPNLFVWLVSLEVLAESSILGWLLMISGIVVPFPTAQWSKFSALWLANLVGILGALLFPLLVLGLCYHLKRQLRRPAGGL